MPNTPPFQTWPPFQPQDDAMKIFRDNVSNGSGVTVRQTNAQTGTTENNTTLAARVVTM